MTGTGPDDGAGQRRPIQLPRSPLTVAGIATSLGLATLPLAAPHSWYARFLVVVFVFTAVAVFVTACAALTARGHRADGCCAIAALVAVPLLLFAVWSPLQRTGLRLRLEHAEGKYQAQAAHLIAQAPAEPYEFRDGHAICRETTGTRAVVGWAWDNGIPFISTGVVYDPEGFLADPARINPRDQCAIRDCDHVDGPWCYCRIY